MKPFTLCASLFALAAHAHNNWPWLIRNGGMSLIWQYVRQNAGGIEPGNPSTTDRTIPEYDVTGTNFTCGRLAFDTARQTQIADVVAGEVVGFRVNQGWDTDDPDALNSGLNHPGPAQAYLAKAPDGVDVRDFSGIDGDWVKIATLGATSNSTWYFASYDVRIGNFTIPAKTPPGQYLLRFEQFWRDNNRNWTQFFINCAQINVIGPGGGDFTNYPFAKIPGAYDAKDPGGFDHFVYDESKGGYYNWVAPGPPVWTG